MYRLTALHSFSFSKWWNDHFDLSCFFNVFFLRFYLFIFRGKGREKERERNINVWLPVMWPPLRTWPTAQACALTGNRTGDPLLHRPALNPLSYTPARAMIFIIENVKHVARYHLQQLLIHGRMFHIYPCLPHLCPQIIGYKFWTFCHFTCKYTCVYVKDKGFK